MDQPRVPAGSPKGGQWAKSSSGATSGAVISRGDWTKRNTPQNQIDAVYRKIWEDFPDPTEGIEAAEQAWAGGVADSGEPEAAYLVQQMPGYFNYRSDIESRVSSVFGENVPLYRSVDYEQLLEWKGGADIGPKGFSLDRKVSENWKNFAGNAGRKQVLVKVNVSPSIIVMRGKAEEQELVVDVNWISFNTVEVL